MNAPAIVMLAEGAAPVARKIQSTIPDAYVYGLATRTQSADRTYESFGDIARELFQTGTPILGICAAGILIRTLAPLLNNKWQEPPVLAIAEDGSAVVPLLGGTQGANELARRVATALEIAPSITASGEIRFQTTLLSPPAGYVLVNPEDGKTFVADILAGESIQLIGKADWIENSRLPLSPDGPLTIRITESDGPEAPIPGPRCLVYRHEAAVRGSLAIVGTGPGAAAWTSPEVQQILRSASDWVGYKTYLNLVEPLRPASTIRHDSDNRVEIDRARFALDLAAQGKRVAVVSSGDPGIFAMAAAVFEVLEQDRKPEWNDIDIEVSPGISAMQAAAARAGAPLGHDFCAISLSDILKPWDVIARRIAAAAEADFAIAFYNPVSKQRTWQLERAKEILLRSRPTGTPVVLARNLGRPGQAVTVKSLEDLEIADADMRTVILVGSTRTRIVQQGSGKQWVYTPRHY